tara:strand:+ start:209 stop:382 length:174 start_codon:yes stop_codon:yes gene_type:complete
MLTDLLIEPIPTTIEEKIRGTIIIFNSLINKSPSGINIVDPVNRKETMIARIIDIKI